MQCEFSAIKVSKKSNVTKVTNATFLFFVQGQNGIFSEKLYKEILKLHSLILNSNRSKISEKL